MHPTRRWRERGLPATLATLATVATLAGLAACKTSFQVEGRETPVHVWIQSPAAGARPQVVDLTILVGEAVAVDGPVRFPAGSTRVAVPPLYLRAGERTVVVRAAGGRTLATAEVEIEHATWILVTVQGTQVSIGSYDREPGSP